MRKTFVMLMASTALLAACSDRSENAETEAVSSLDVEDAPAAEMAPVSPEPIAAPPPASISPGSEPAADAAHAASSSTIPVSSGSIPVSMPQIAYRYALGFRLPDDAIKPLQNRHADMCEARGPSECRIISMRQAEREGDYSYGSLQIAVASHIARDFSRELEESSGTVDGELVSSTIDGEDLSKQIVDTEARLRARTVLRDRLLDVLRTRNGTVEELVEAERGVAQVNEEIDQAKSWLTEMRGRVAFSQMAITYEAGVAAPTSQPSSFVEPIQNAWGTLGAILGTIIALLMMAVTVVVPLGLVVLAIIRLRRWMTERGVVAA